METSNGLVSSMSRYLPPSVAGAVMSPVTIGEILLRALGDLILPLLLVIGLAVWLLRRFSSDEDDRTATDPEMS